MHKHEGDEDRREKNLDHRENDVEHDPRIAGVLGRQRLGRRRRDAGRSGNQVTRSFV